YVFFIFHIVFSPYFIHTCPLHDALPIFLYLKPLHVPWNIKPLLQVRVHFLKYALLLVIMNEKVIFIPIMENVKSNSNHHDKNNFSTSKFQNSHLKITFQILRGALDSIYYLLNFYKAYLQVL